LCLAAAHVTENSKTERKFLTHASEGDIEGLEQTVGALLHSYKLHTK